MFIQFGEVFGKLDSTQTRACLGELLGPEERIMLTKRMAAVVLLVEGYSQYKTAMTLKLSQATTKGLAEKIERGDFDNVLKALGKSKKNYASVLETLDSILHLGGILPHYNGLDRYRGLRG